MNKRLVAIGAALAMVTAGVAYASDSDFEGFLTGQSVDGQGGWSTTDQWGNDAWGNTGPAFDEAIVDDGTGNTVWRLSNAVTTGGLSAQPMSQVSGEAAGETGAALWNDRGLDHTNPLSPPNPGAYATTKYFFGSFDFSSATGAAQDGLAISISPTCKRADGRMAYVSIADDGVNGFDVYFYETGITTDPWGTGVVYEEIASDLSYTQTHNISIAMEFVDGLEDVGGDLYGNDIVTVLVNGSVAITGSSWETHYYGLTPHGLTAADKRAVNTLGFFLRGTAAPSVDGGGFYIDNVVVNNTPEPASLGLLAMGAAALIRRR